MALIDRPADMVWRIRVRTRDQAYGRVADGVGRAVRELLDRMAGSVQVTAAAGPETWLWSLGQLSGWWTQALEVHVAPEVWHAWWLGASTVDDETMPEQSRQVEHVANVTDRLSRQVSPTLPEAAMDRVRRSLAYGLGAELPLDEVTTRVAAALDWRGGSVPAWESALEQVNGRIDSLLDRHGPPGSDERRVAREGGDPLVDALQRERSWLVRQIEADRSEWQIRAERIARTESQGAYTAGSLAAGEQVGAGAKLWVATGDARTRDSHVEASGQCRPLDGLFDVGGSVLQGPGDPSAPPEETVNCRCVLLVGRSCDRLSFDYGWGFADEVVRQELDRRG